MKSIEKWFSEYEVSHQNQFNKTIHYIFVPLIFFSIIGLLVSIPMGNIPNLFPSILTPYIHLGTLLVFFGLIFYFRLSPVIFIGMLIISGFSLWANHMIDQYFEAPLWIISLMIFVISWIFQFIGHKHEGAKPSFLKDIQFLLVGPAWILGKLYSQLGIKY